MYPVDIEPAQLCRAFFVLVSAAALGANAIPSLRQWFISYGARSVQESPTRATSHIDNSSKSTFFLALAARLQVPHSWFTHYYIISVLFSIFWAYQLLMRGTAFRFLAALSISDTQVSMTINQILLVWLMMVAQGCRRFYECITLFKPSAAKMPITSWVLGVSFYAVLSVSIWIEGIPALLKPHELISLSRPSSKTFIAVPLFLLASKIQHDCHEYLSSLEKYTVPEHPLFQRVLCPHYTCECMIYLALAIVAAPKGQFLNKTISTALLFTATNLAITAESTRLWYSGKFEADKTQKRWRMVPFLY